MNFKKLYENSKFHLLAIAVFFIVSLFMFSASFSGKIHKEEDMTQGYLKNTEITKYEKETGETPGWTNSIFSGMPTTLFKGPKTPYANKIGHYSYMQAMGTKATYPFKIILLSMIGFYIMLTLYKVKPTIAIFGAIAYAFTTFSISSIEAAHYTKVLSMAMLPVILGCLHAIYRGNYIGGATALAFHFGLQTYYFHYQISYYTAICVVVMGIYYLIEAIQIGEIKKFALASILGIIAIGAGTVANYSKLSNTSEFAKETMRGGNDMAKADEKSVTNEAGVSGLNRDYAFSWSYAKGETFTLLIPNFYGGSTREKLSKSSAFYEKTQNDEAIEQGLPMYHGELQFTSGPIYVGAIVVFLFILGLFVVKSKIKWALLALTLISFFLAWGKHFPQLNNFLFDYLPMYNKFRTPMMAMAIAQVTMPLLGFLAIKEIYEHSLKIKVSLKNWDSDFIVKSVFISFALVGGFCLLMALFGPSVVDMSGPVDAELSKGGNKEIIPILLEDRASLLRQDSFRSFIFIALAFVLMMTIFTKQLKKETAFIIIGVLCAIDLIGVSQRYLKNSDFNSEIQQNIDVEKDAADNMILTDKTLHYRILDLTKDPFNDNSGAAFHKMVGGYDPAKLSRYQDFISELISKNEYREKALDILNCKYLIGTNDNSSQRVPQLRESANGNAWFTKELVSSANAKLEMDNLKTIDHKSKTTFNAEFERNKSLKAASYQVDSSSSISLISYHPDTMVYNYSNTNNGFVTFSEIYYDNWKAFVDGKETPVYKVNYTLRGIESPAGNHQIKLVFEKASLSKNKVDFYVSLFIIAAFLINIVMWLMKFRE